MKKIYRKQDFPPSKIRQILILEVVKAHVAKESKYPCTLHYRGEGTFITSGSVLHKAQKFTKFKNDPNF